jgi:CheY-like chemotaxis protein
MMPVQTRRVLLVDDDPARVEHLTQLLRQYGLRTCSARNGAAGLLAIYGHPPDLIVLDAEMPVMDGYQVLQVLMSDPELCRIPVILLTPRGDVSEIVRGWLYGAEACHPGDADLADLALLVRRTLQPQPEADMSLTA